MAQGHRRGGCFRCGSPHHSQWECKVDLDQPQVSSNRKLEHDVHYLDNPQVKKGLGNIRLSKYAAKLEIKKSSDTVSWGLISAGAQRLLDFFLEQEEELQRIRRLPIGLDGKTSSARLAEVRNTYDNIQSRMEDARLIVASSGAKKDDNYNQLELNIIRGSVATLAEVRNRVHALGTRALHQVSNLNHSIHDLQNLHNDISSWCEEFLKFNAMRPPATDLPKLDDQLISKRVNFRDLEQRGGHITELVPSLEARVAAVVEDAKRKLDLAGAVRSSIENKSPYCRCCNGRVEVAYACGHGVCRKCYRESKNCRICPKKK